MWRVVLCVLGVAMPATAAPNAHLIIVGDTCPTELIHSRIGEQVPGGLDASARRTVTVVFDDAGALGATVRVDGAERHLVAASCEELTEAIALIVAIALLQPEPPPPMLEAEPVTQVLDPEPATTSHPNVCPSESRFLRRLTNTNTCPASGSWPSTWRISFDSPSKDFRRLVGSVAKYTRTARGTRITAVPS